MAIATLSIDLEAKLANLERDFSKASRLAEDNARKMKSAYSDVGKTFESLGAALAGAVGVNFFTTLVVSAIDAQDKLKDLSKSTSLSVETLAGLSSVAQKTGSDIDGIADAINKLSVNMGKDAEKFAKLGIVAKDPVEAFKQLADVFNAIEDPQKRAAVAAEALGKSWKSAAPALSEGSKAIGEMIERGQKLSGITSESADKADELNDNFADLKGSVGGLATQFANSLVPSLTDTVKAMNAAIEKGNILESVIRGIAGIGKIPFDMMLGDIDMTVGAQIKELDQQLATLGRRRREGENGGLLNQWLYGSTEELDKKIEITRNQLDALKKYGDRLTKPVAASSGVESPKEKDIKGFLGGDSTSKKSKAAKSEEVDYYEQIIRLQKEANKETAEREKLAEQLGKEADKYRDLIDPAQKYREELAKIAALVESGNLSPLEGMEASALKQKELEEAIYGTTDALVEQADYAKELGLTFSSAFEDAVVGGEKFSTVLKSIGQDIAKMILRKNVTEPLANAVGSINWSKLFTQNANGGVYDSPSLSAFSGGVYNSPQLFKFAAGAGVFGEAGPEAIMPLKRGPDGKLGVSGGGGSSVNIVVHNEAGGDGYQASATAKQNGSGIDINVIVTKAIQNDMKRNGPITQGFSQMFGMNRSAA